MKITELRRPFICGTLWDTDRDSAVRTIRLAELDGADAFELNLLGLGKIDVESLKDIISSTSKPMFTTNRRRDGWGRRFEGSEEQRMEVQLKAFDAGTAGFDMEIDTFDPGSGPMEFTEKKAAVEKQMRLIEDVRSRGGEIMISCHKHDSVFTVENALRIGTTIEQRGANMAKIIGRGLSYDDLIETLRANLALREKLKIPFIHFSMGEYAKLSRTVGAMLGSMLVYAQQELHAKGFLWHQPVIRNARQILSNIDFVPTLAARETRLGMR